MTSCAGPYTRVYFDKRESAKIAALADTLAAAGLIASRVALPRGRGGLDDLSADMGFEGDGLQALRLAKFLGPKGLLTQTHIFEIAFESRQSGGSLFDTKLARLIARFTDHRDALCAGDAVADVVATAEAHETRIELCNGL